MVTEIENFNQIISDWIQAYYADGLFLLLAIGAFVYLYVTCKDLRYKFLLPIFVMVFIAVNPILYKYIFSRIIYWRLLWMLPNVILIAAAVVVFLKKQTKVWMKWGVFAVAAVVIMSQGQYVFSYGVFFPRSNWEKVSQETIDVCDIMLERNSNPKVIVPVWLSTEIRQYAPEISMLYGRDVTGDHIRKATSEGFDVYHNLFVETNYNYTFMKAVELEVDFVVDYIDSDVEEYILENYNYKEIYRGLEYIVYGKEY